MKVIANAAVRVDAESGAFPRQMYVDYFDHQERMDCEGITVLNEPSDLEGSFVLSDWGDRTITDGYILVDGNAPFVIRGSPVNQPWQPGDYAVLTAATEIVIKPMFDVELGGNLIAQIQPCVGNFKQSNAQDIGAEPEQLIYLPSQDTAKASLVGDASIHSDAHLGLRIFPNPAKESCQIDGLMEGDQVQIQGLLGSKVLSAFEAHDKNATLNLLEFPQGVYLIHVNRIGKLLPVLKLVKI